MITPAHITGLLLAGGRATRMGGVDKGLQLFRGQPLALHVLTQLRRQAGALLISANRNADAYRALAAAAGLDAPVLADADADFAGPLAGILAGLRHAHTPYLLIAPCDAPLLPADLAARLAGALIETAPQAAPTGIAMAVTTDATGQVMRHPVFALLSVALADDLERTLAAGQRKVGAWYARHKLIEVPFADERAFYNINTLQELNDLERT